MTVAKKLLYQQWRTPNSQSFWVSSLVIYTLCDFVPMCEYTAESTHYLEYLSMSEFANVFAFEFNHVA